MNAQPEPWRSLGAREESHGTDERSRHPRGSGEVSRSRELSSGPRRKARLQRKPPSAGKSLSPLPSCLLPTHRSSPTGEGTAPRLPPRPRPEVRCGLARGEHIPSSRRGPANASSEVSRFLATSESRAHNSLCLYLVVTGLEEAQTLLSSLWVGPQTTVQRTEARPWGSTAARGHSLTALALNFGLCHHHSY